MYEIENDYGSNSLLCDIPKKSLESSIDQIINDKPDFVLYLGDIADHEIELYTEDSVSQAID